VRRWRDGHVIRPLRLAIAGGLVVGLLTPLLAQRGPNIITRIDTSDDVVFLEQLATDYLAAQSVARPYGAKSVRSRAYIRLGALATAESLAAARRIEAAARAWTLVPETISLDYLPHPSGHFSDAPVTPIAEVRGDDGLTYGVAVLELLGGLDLFLTTTRTPGDGASWSRPLLIPGRAPYAARRADLSWNDDGTLQLDVVVPGREERDVRRFWPQPEEAATGLHSWTIDLARVRQDTDADGWTDLAERRLRLNPASGDTDGDGIPDGLDVSPAHAPSPIEGTDEEAAILRKVFFAGIGIHGSRRVLVGDGRSRPLQLWGSKGPMLFGVDRSAWTDEHVRTPMRVSWRVTALTRDEVAGDSAVAILEDYVGSLAAAGYTVTLRKLDGEWFVVKMQMDWIS